MVAACQLPTSSSDRELQRQITVRLAESPRPAVRKLGVQVVNGCVLLRGRLATFYEVQLAIQSCRMLAGSLREIDIANIAIAN